MAKYLLEVAYTAEGAKGLIRDGGSKRRAAAEAAARGVGAKVESFHFAFGASDAYLVIDAPDNISIAAVALAVNAGGSVRTRTTVLLTPEEVDQAVKKAPAYTPPGQ
jgi:uncharacterized protein with GYD domain